MKLIKLTFSLSVLCATLSVSADESQTGQESWYIGGGVGASTLTPDGGKQWNISDDRSVSKKIYTGVGITENTGVEAFWSDLGAVDLNNGSKKGSINYQTIGIAGVYKPPLSFKGVSPIGKLGVAKIINKDKGEVVSEQLHGHSVFVGLGAEYALTDNINVRAEYERYDKDIQQYNLGINWKPLQKNKSRLIEDVALQEPAPRIEHIPVVIPIKPKPPAVIYRPAYQPPVTPKPEYKPILAPEPVYNPPTIKKPVYQPPVIKKPTLQIIHTSLSGGSNFNTGSSELTSFGEKALSKLADDLQEKGMRVKKLDITGHTDDVGNDHSNFILSLARANAVATYLDYLGVDRYLMDISGKGESQAIASNATAEGRAKNRRVSIKIQGARTIIKR